MWWKKEKKIFTFTKKKKEVIGLTKDKKAAKIITKFAAPVAKSFSYCVQKDDHEIDDSEFISARWVKKVDTQRVKNLWLWKMCFQFNKRSYNKRTSKLIKHVIYTIVNNKIALCKFNDKRILDEDGIIT